MDEKGRGPAQILITGIGPDTMRHLRSLAAGITEMELVICDDGRLIPPYSGVLYETVELCAANMGISVNEYLDMVEAYRYDLCAPERIPSLADLDESIFTRPTVNMFKPGDECDDLYLSESQIRKRLKYEKNPMMIKQLNKMLYGKRK